MRVYVINGIGGQQDVVGEQLREMLSSAGICDVRLFRSYQRHPRLLNVLVAIGRAIWPRGDADAHDLARQVLRERYQDRRPNPDSLAFVAASAGAIVASNAALLLQPAGVSLDLLVTFGAVTMRPKPHNVAHWIGVVGSYDWARILSLARPDETIMVSGVRHNQYATKGASLTQFLFGENGPGVRHRVMTRPTCVRPSSEFSAPEPN